MYMGKDYTDFDEVYRKYKFPKPFTILNKPFNKNSVVFHFSKKSQNVQETVLKVKEYFEYLNNCKERIIELFYEIVNSFTYKNITLDEIINIEWYEYLKVTYVMIYIHENEINSRIYCKDKYNDPIVFFFHDNILSIDYQNEYNIFRDFVDNNQLIKLIENDEENNSNSKFCKIHKCKMKLSEIPILYGLPIGPIVGYEEDRENNFPNCDDEILGGCCIDDDHKFETKYVCEKCNIAREEWKESHSSEIFFHLNCKIKENIVIFLNDEKQFLLNKCNEHDCYWVKIIAIPNGKYSIVAMCKITKNILSKIEIDLKNEILYLNIEKNDHNIYFEIKYKNKLRALWT